MLIRFSFLDVAPEKEEQSAGGRGETELDEQSGQIEREEKDRRDHTPEMNLREQLPQ